MELVLLIITYIIISTTYTRIISLTWWANETIEATEMEVQKEEIREKKVDYLDLGDDSSVCSEIYFGPLLWSDIII